MALLETIILLDTRANQPAGSAVGAGTMYSVTDEGNKLERSNGTTWDNYGPTVSSSTTGNAATATALQTARTINGTSFNGTANITVTAAAGTLTGGSLTATVLGSSLTSVGTLATLTVTAAIVGSVTGSAATLTTPRNINGVAFDGSAPITVTAAAGTLTGATLAAGVTASSLTSVGTLVGLTLSGVILAADGSSTDPAYAFAADTSLGFYRPAASQMYMPAARVLGMSYGTSGGVYIVGQTMNGAIQLGSGSKLSWGSTHEQSAQDVNISRLSAGVMGVGTGASGSFAGAITAATFTGALVGNASTATTAAALTTPRTINTVSFDGSANIVVTAAAGTLTGATLAAGVLASSLTSVGTLTGGATGAGFTVALTTSTITGSLADARLSGNVALLNGINTWSNLQTFSGGVSMAGALAATQDNITTTPTTGFTLQNTTASTSGVAVQMAPRLQFRGHVWNTTATAIDNTEDWYLEVLPASSAAPTSTFKFNRSGNGAATTTPLSVTSAGTATALNAFNVSTSGGIASSGGTTGLFLWRNFAGSTGVGIDVATDAVFKVRTRAHSAYATVDALGYSVGGVAGASKGAGAVTSITVVNGIVTACT